MNLKEKVAYLCFDRKKRMIFGPHSHAQEPIIRQNKVNLFKLWLYFSTYFKLVINICLSSF